jgi:hypothetical protein
MIKVQNYFRGVLGVLHDSTLLLVLVQLCMCNSRRTHDHSKSYLECELYSSVLSIFRMRFTSVSSIFSSFSHDVHVPIQHPLFSYFFTLHLNLKVWCGASQCILHER